MTKVQHYKIHERLTTRRGRTRAYTFGSRGDRDVALTLMEHPSCSGRAQSRGESGASSLSLGRASHHASVVDRARDAERAPLFPRRTGDDGDGGDVPAYERESARSSWPSATTLRGIAFAAMVFALGTVTGSATRRSRDAVKIENARLEAIRAIDEAIERDRATVRPALGLSQYERDVERARTATNRALRHAPQHPPDSGWESIGALGSNITRVNATHTHQQNATRSGPPANATHVRAENKQPVASAKPSEPEASQPAQSLDDAGDDLFSRTDNRPVIKGIVPELEKTRARLLDTNKEDENDMGFYRYPTVAKGMVGFVSETNIWIAPLKGGIASRLSSTYSREGVPKLSPDGVYVAFLGLTYDGYDVFVAPTKGGVVEQITFGGKAQDVASWPSKDELLVISSAFSSSMNAQLVRVNPSTRKASPLPFAKAVEGVKDGLGCYAFVPLRQTSETKRYEGGEQSRLWRWCKGDSEATQLTPESTWGLRGAWSPESSNDAELKDHLFFISDKTGVSNVWVMNVHSTASVQLTHECLFDIKEISIDGRELIYRRGGSLFMRQIMLSADNTIRLGNELQLKYELVSEFRKTMESEIENPYGSMSEFVLTNDGAFAAFVIRGQVFYSALVPFLGSRVEKVTTYKGAVRYKHIQFVSDASSDGQPKILALSDSTGEYEYVMLERQVEGGHWKETQITSGAKIKGAMEFSSISPDNTKLILADTNGNLKLINLTETAVNTNRYRTTEPKPVLARLAKRSIASNGPSAKTSGATKKPKFGRIPETVSVRHRQNSARRAGRFAMNKRANKHLRNIGVLRKEAMLRAAPNDPANSAISGLATVENLLGGFRPEGVYGLSWSPDGSWLAYAKDEENDFTSIHVLELSTGDSTRITTPSYNAHSPRFSPDGLYLYYFSDQQIVSSANSPYGARGAEPVFSETSRLMCVPLRLGMTCPFFIGDEITSEGTVFDAAFGKVLPTVISTQNIEQRAQAVPDLPDAEYLSFEIIADGSGMLLTVADQGHIVVAAYSMYKRQAVPLFADPASVIVSGDLQIITFITNEGVALVSSKSVLSGQVTPEQLLSGTEVWNLPESFTVIVNPREEWLQMYEEAMRNMRDAFYDPNLHGVDWRSVTDRYRPLVYKISSKGELRDILGQAFGELSALHVFVSVQSEDPVIPLGTPSSCLGADFTPVPEGLKIAYIHRSTGVLDAPHSSLSRSTETSFVNLIPGDIITKIDGVLVNSTSRPLSDLLRGKAGTQVLLEVIKIPRSADEKRDEENLVKLQQMRMMQKMMGGVGLAQSQLGSAAQTNKPVTDLHVANLVRKHAAKLGASTLSAKAGDASQKPGTLAEAVKTPDSASPELIIITPLLLEQCDALEAADEVVRRREYVEKKTDGQVAYVYLEDMEQQGKGSSNSFDDFAAQFYPNVRKNGLIIDVRRNAGGNIDTWLLERLRRVAWMFDTERSGPGDTTMQYTFRGKVVVLIDEQTSSDAEMFALGIQQLKIGVVIGERTWGGAIGYSGHPELRLVDDSGFTIPSYGPYLHGDWAIEQKGVKPDIVVSNLPLATFNGKDAQLDTAIEKIKAMIAEAPDTSLPKPPTYPVRAFDSKNCAAPNA